MPRKAEPGSGGGGRFLGKDGWLSLADAGAVVLIQRVTRIDDFVNERKERAEQIQAHVLVVASKGGKRTGEFWPEQNVISRAIVSKIGDPLTEDEEGGPRLGAKDGEVIAARIVKLGSSTPYPGANEPSDPEYAAVEKFYTDRNLNPDDPADDARLFENLLAEHAKANRDNVKSTTANLKGKGRPSSADETADADDDDTPPF